VGMERMGFIQKIHRHVVADMMPPPINGPQMNARPVKAPSTPLTGASLERGTEFDRMVRTPDKIPPAPTPATARPLI
ncbi:MAG: hypothetical protein Q9198_005654, partial [Flavoplaca austrocitrina]